MVESLAALHARVVASLAIADELKLAEVGIRLDQARLYLESELFRRKAGSVTRIASVNAQVPDMIN